VVIEIGATPTEIVELLHTLAQETPPGELPLALRDEIPEWEHARLFSAGYERLTLKGEATDDDEGPVRSVQLWLGLAQAAMSSNEPISAAELPGLERLAETIRDHEEEAGRESPYDQVIVGYMLQLADELRTAESAEAKGVGRRVSGLIQELDDDTLARLMEMGGSATQQKQFLLDANQSFAAEAVVKVLDSASGTSGQQISDSLCRMLTKLAAHADRDTGQMKKVAGTALHKNVEKLIADWDLEDPNPDRHTMMLDQMARSAPVLRSSDGFDARDKSAPQRRVLHMAIEVDAYGPIVHDVVSDLLLGGDAEFVVDLVTRAPEDNAAVGKVREQLQDPQQLHEILAEEQVDEQAIIAVANRIGEVAIPVLLDTLADSESLATRRILFDQLVRMGDPAGHAAASRLGDERWYVLRNLLQLVARLEEFPPDLDARSFLDYPDARVLREAMPILLRHPDTRARALAQAFSAEDERLVHMALIEAQNGIPDTVLAVLVNQVVLSKRPSELRATAVRTMKNERSPLTLNTLLRTATPGRTWFGRRKKLAATPVVIAALEVLAEHWRDDARAGVALEWARRSTSPEVREAAGEVAGE